MDFREPLIATKIFYFVFTSTYELIISTPDVKVIWRHAASDLKSLTLRLQQMKMFAPWSSSSVGRQGDRTWEGDTKDGSLL